MDNTINKIEKQWQHSYRKPSAKDFNLTHEDVHQMRKRFILKHYPEMIRVGKWLAKEFECYSQDEFRIPMRFSVIITQRPHANAFYKLNNTVSKLEKDLTFYRSRNNTKRVKFDIEALRENNKLSEVIEQYGTQLKKVGKEFLCCCPFHDDSKPSMSVNDEKGVYYCHACGAKGDVFNFIMQTEGCSFQGACSKLK